MLLTRYNYKNIKHNVDQSLSSDMLSTLPEKVLQFGTGVLLRGLPDYFIDKANRQGLFNGSVVVVKSTDSGDASSFDKQDNLYTICVRGIEGGKKVEEDLINASISRVLSAKGEWGKILQCAHNAGMRVIISNTTEVGISFVKDDIHLSPPVSFPGKLLAFLYERYKAFCGSDESGMVIVPTELIPDNGNKLEAIVLEQAHVNGLEASFMDWLENANYFCNSLVDRIVPGAPSPSMKSSIEEHLGYTDELLILAEPYRLWAIETPSPKVKEILSFSDADPGVVVAPDISKFRELKLRLLNGTHTLSCGLAVLAGFNTVKEAMQDGEFKEYMLKVMTNDIIPVLLLSGIPREEANDFARNVLDRFSNPFIEHKWISITMQYSSKMKMRNLPVLLGFYSEFRSVPEYLSLGFAGYILFMKGGGEDSGFESRADGLTYTIQDDKAPFFSQAWGSLTVEELVIGVLQEESLWGTDLTEIQGFSQAVTANLTSLIEQGPKQTIRNMLSVKSAAAHE